MKFKESLVKAVHETNFDQLPGCTNETDSREARDEALLFLDVAYAIGGAVILDDTYRETYAMLKKRPNGADFGAVIEYLKKVQDRLKEICRT